MTHKTIREIIERYGRYAECEEFHIHNDTEDAEKEPYEEHKDFDEDQAEQAILAFIEEKIGEDEQRLWDDDYGYCDRCAFEPTDDTKNCICVFRNRLRAELRTAFGIKEEKSRLETMADNAQFIADTFREEEK